jgi:integrase
MMPDKKPRPLVAKGVIITAYYQQRGDSYTLKVSVGYENGKHKVVCKTWRPENGWSENKVKIELYKELDNFEKEVKSGRRFEAFTFKEVAEEWFSDYADTRHRSTTIQSKNSRKIRIYKEFGDKRLDSITPHQIQHFISSLAKPGANTITDGSLSYKTIKHHLGFLQGVFSYAVRMKYISENPCIGVTLGRKTEEEKEIPTKDEVNAMFVKMQGKPMSGNTPYTWLKRFCERNNLKFYGIHAFRYFFASVQINGGTVDFQVSRALGHSQTSTTKNIYTHIIDDYQSKIAQVIEDSVEF